jgi:hypothetical protein
MTALVIQVVVVGFLALGWSGFAGGADNPMWFYLGAVLQFPASLLFEAMDGALVKSIPEVAQRFQVAGAFVAALEFVLLSFAIKKVRDHWLS